LPGYGWRNEPPKENGSSSLTLNFIREIAMKKITAFKSGLPLILIIACLLGMTHVPCSCQSDRETWQPPEVIMDSIGVKPGMRIGEAGAGYGYFTFPLARRVGSGGIVYANDIFSAGFESIRERAGKDGLENIKTVLGGGEDPLFPEKNLDMVVMVYVLHEVERRIPFLKNLRSYLKPGGLLVIIERNTPGDRNHIPPFMTKSQVLETAGKAGFELDRIETFLEYDSIYILKNQN